MHSLPKPFNDESTLPWEKDLEIEASEPDYPSVSIVIPVYKAGAFIERTIRSLLCNDMSGVQLILMDGGSKDATMEIVEHYRQFFSVTHSAPDKGQSDAINRGFDQANHDLLYWLNGDDLLLPGTLNQVRAYFRDNHTCEVLVGNAYMTELDLTSINHFVYAPEKLTFEYLLDYAGNHLVQPSVFFTRKAWDACGPVNNDYHYAMDADLFIGMANEFSLQHLDLDIAYSVYHENCKTRDARAESITELALVQASHGGLTQAAKTLSILVDMYNQAKSAPSSDTDQGSVSNNECSKCKSLELRLEDLNKIIENNKRAYLEIDMMEET